MPFPLLMLVRFLDDRIEDHHQREWLIVKDSQYEGQSVDEAMEVMRFPWNDDLKIWMNAHQEKIDTGDVNVFLEYRRRRQSAASQPTNY
jgi:hypothetical protein